MFNTLFSYHIKILLSYNIFAFFWYPENDVVSKNVNRKWAYPMISR